MAKRKRLTPAKMDAAPARETKSALSPGRAFQTRPPIADVAHDASATAALSEVAQTLTDARADGRLIQALPLDIIDADYLVRDHMAVDADDMASLIESRRARGQQTAIEITALDNERYGLISGWRRLTALRQMRGQNSTVDTVLAINRTPEDAADAYLAMVEENEIRVGLSYYERARIVARAVDRGVYTKDRLALAALFHAASRPKRSKIGSFLRIVRSLDDHLRFPTALTERTGLALAQALEAQPDAAPRVIAALADLGLTTPQAELDAITAMLQEATVPTSAAKPNAPITELLPNGIRLVTAKDGRLTLKGPQMQDADFRARLSQV